VLIATPPQETRNWADADKVVPNAVPPEETVSRLLACFRQSSTSRPRGRSGLELAPTLVAPADEVIE
jgi:hypothetical protein